MELRHVTAPEAARLLNAALNDGITYIDTSPDYGPSERYIGQAIAHRRDAFILATKCGCNVDAEGKPLDPPHLWSRDRLARNLEDSLRLLKTDHLDVWQLHGTTPEELAGGRADTVIQAMQEFKQQGRVCAIGLSFRNGRAGEALHPAGFGFEYIEELMSWGVFDVMQIVYGGLTRQNEVRIAQAAGQGIGIIVRGVVKRYREDYDARFASAKLDELCAPGESPNSFLIRFALNHPGIGTMIVGTRSAAHLTENIAAASQGKLPDEVYREAVRRLDAIGLTPGRPS